MINLLSNFKIPFLYFRYLFWTDFKDKVDEIKENSFTWFHTFLGFTGAGIVSSILSHCFLVYGAYRDDPKYLKKWMITNGIIYVVLLILVLGILFTGYFRMYLTKTQFISALSAISVIAGVRQFSWLVVFQYRWNLLRLEEVKKFELEEGMY